MAAKYLIFEGCIFVKKLHQKKTAKRKVTFIFRIITKSTFRGAMNIKTYLQLFNYFNEWRLFKKNV